MMRGITKAIITAAGYGTRFLPATKNVPKELLNLIDKPSLEYITEECVQSGIKDIIVVTSFGKNGIIDYLDSSPDLEEYLERKGKYELKKVVKNVYSKANFFIVRQQRNLPYGTASPLYSAKNLISKNEAFAYIFPDDIFLGKKPALRELIDYFMENELDAVLGSKFVDSKDVYKYGVFDFEEINGVKYFRGVIEKPKSGYENGGYARLGRFIYKSDLLPYLDLKLVESNERNEFELTDIENKYSIGRRMAIKEISSEYYPTGDPINMIKSGIKLALSRNDTKGEISSFIKDLKLDI